MSNKNPKYIQISDMFEDTIAITSDVGFTVEIVNLHTTIEAISGADGKQIQVSDIRIHLRIYSEEELNLPYCILPVIVQTAGTWGANFDLALNTVRQLLDNSIDDVLGYYALGSFRVSKHMPSFDSHIKGIEITISIPQHILQLLNKETETERLQSLLVGVVGKAGSVAAQNIELTAYTEIFYTERRKNIVIR